VDSKSVIIEALENKFIPWIFANVSPQIFILNLKLLLAEIINTYPPFNIFFLFKKEKRITDMIDFQKFIKLGDGIPSFSRIAPSIFTKKPLNSKYI